MKKNSYFPQTAALLLAAAVCVSGQDAHADQSAAAKTTDDKAWINQQMQRFRDEILKKHTDRLAGIEIEVLPVGGRMVQLSYEGMYPLGNHFTSVREYRLLDRQRKEIVDVDKALTYPIRMDMTDRAYRKLLELEKSGWRGTPADESERRFWLAQNMHYVFSQGGHFRQNKRGGLDWRFCSMPTLDNTFQFCSDIPDVQPDSLIRLPPTE